MEELSRVNLWSIDALLTNCLVKKLPSLTSMGFAVVPNVATPLVTVDVILSVIAKT